MLRHGLRALLERHAGEVVAEASDGRMAAAAAREHHPDVAVLDIMMPLLNGIDAAREIAATCPDTQVVLLTALDQERLVTEAVSAGVRGFVLKTQAEEDLVQAIEQVSRGGFYVGGGVSRAVVEACRAAAAQDRGRLTPRERQVVQLVAAGKSTKQVAAQGPGFMGTVPVGRAGVSGTGFGRAAPPQRVGGGTFRARQERGFPPWDAKARRLGAGRHHAHGDARDEAAAPRGARSGGVG